MDFQAICSPIAATPQSRKQWRGREGTPDYPMVTGLDWIGLDWIGRRVAQLHSHLVVNHFHFVKRAKWPAAEIVHFLWL